LLRLECESASCRAPRDRRTPGAPGRGRRAKAAGRYQPGPRFPSSDLARCPLSRNSLKGRAFDPGACGRPRATDWEDTRQTTATRRLQQSIAAARSASRARPSNRHSVPEERFHALTLANGALAQARSREAGQKQRSNECIGRRFRSTCGWSETEVLDGGAAEGGRTAEVNRRAGEAASRNAPSPVTGRDVDTVTFASNE